MTEIEFVPPAPAAHYTMMFYGEGGSGKTVAASGAPGPILYLNGDGAGALRWSRKSRPEADIREVAIRNRASLEDAYRYLAGPDGADVRTVVLDSMASIYGLILDDLAGKNHPTLPEYGDAGITLDRYVKALARLPVNVVLIAHENPVKDDASGEVTRYPLVSTSSTALAVKMMLPLDVVAWCTRIAGADPQGADDQFLAQVVPGRGRYGCKDRTNTLGRTAPLDLPTWFAGFQAAEAVAPNAVPTEGEVTA